MNPAYENQKVLNLVFPRTAPYFVSLNEGLQYGGPMIPISFWRCIFERVIGFRRTDRSLSSFSVSFLPSFHACFEY